MKSFFFISQAAVREVQEQEWILFYTAEWPFLLCTLSLLLRWNYIYHQYSHKATSQTDACSEDHGNAICTYRIKQLFILAHCTNANSPIRQVKWITVIVSFSSVGMLLCHVPPTETLWQTKGHELIFSLQPTCRTISTKVGLPCNSSHRTGSLMQISNQPMPWQQLIVFRHIQMVNMVCRQPTEVQIKHQATITKTGQQEIGKMLPGWISIDF